MRYKHHIYLILLICTLWSCKTEVENVEFDTEINAYVENEKGQPIADAQVAIFDNYDLYKKAQKEYSTVDAVVTMTTSSEGLAHFDNLTPDTKFWIACFSKDSSYVPGTSIHLNNQDFNYELSFKLRKGSVNDLKIKLFPSDGIVTFWVKEVDQKKLPYSVTVNKKFEGTITQSFAKEPAALQEGTVSAIVQKGIGTYFVKSSECSWTGTVIVTAGKTSIVELSPCETGTLSFFTDITDSTEFPISIVLNNYETLPDLTIANAKTDTLQCNTPGIYQFYKAAGNYSYKAISKSRKCLWVGQKQVITNECAIVKLPKCF